MCGCLYNGIQVSVLDQVRWLSATPRELCHSVVPFLSSISSVHSSSSFPIGLPASTVVPCISHDSFFFLSSTRQCRIYPTRRGLIPFFLPLIPCRAAVDSLFTKRGSIIGIHRPAALISDVRQGQSIVTWSVLPLIAVVDPHTFNSGHAYLLGP